MRNSSRNRITFLAVILCGAANSISSARSDSAWPPVQATEQRQSVPVQVGAATFTTGFYTYLLPIYIVDNVNYSKSIQIGPRHYWAIVGLGGDEPIGPGFGSEGAKAAGAQPRNSQLLQPKSRSNALPPLPALSPISPLPALQALPDLPPIESLPPLPALPPLNP